MRQREELSIDDRAGVDEARRPLAGGRAAGREEREVEALDRLLVETAHDEVAAVEAGAGERPPDVRSEANGTISRAGKPRSRSRRSISVPTCPVAPTTATR